MAPRCVRWDAVEVMIINAKVELFPGDVGVVHKPQFNEYDIPVLVVANLRVGVGGY